MIKPCPEGQAKFTLSKWGQSFPLCTHLLWSLHLTKEGCRRGDSSRGIHRSLEKEAKRLQTGKSLATTINCWREKYSSAAFLAWPGEHRWAAPFIRSAGRSPSCADWPSLPDRCCSCTFPSALCNQMDGSGWKPNPALCQTTSFSMFIHASKAPTKPWQLLCRTDRKTGLRDLCF